MQDDIETEQEFFDNIDVYLAPDWLPVFDPQEFKTKYNGKTLDDFRLTQD